MFICSGLYAQQSHFVFIESLNKQPFTIKFENKEFFSGTKNYITLSKLNNGLKTIIINMKNESESKFSIPVENNDLGYSLKQNSNNDWVLFDILSFKTLEQGNLNNEIIAKVEGQKIIVEQPLVIEEQKKETPQLQKIETASVLPESQHKPVQEAVIEVKIEIQNSISKISDAKNLTGVYQKYVHVTQNSIDTIDVFIPFKEIIKKDTIIEVFRPLIEEKKMESQNIDVIPIATNNCSDVATESDVTEFIHMLQKSPVIKNKMGIAASFLKTKCFSTNQIKRLSVLFMYDKAKLDFFKLAQQSISDPENYQYLEYELRDDMYQKEFRNFITQP